MQSEKKTLEDIHFVFIHTNLSIQLLIGTEHDAKNGDRKLNQPVETSASLYKIKCHETDVRLCV
jgi:hypothetical protein